ncbi:hypothetical protein ACFL2V_01035 [Pseudomonadota bacterium]
MKQYGVDIAFSERKEKEIKQITNLDKANIETLTEIYQAISDQSD